MSWLCYLCCYCCKKYRQLNQLDETQPLHNQDSKIYNGSGTNSENAVEKQASLDQDLVVLVIGDYGVGKTSFLKLMKIWEAMGHDTFDYDKLCTISTKEIVNGCSVIVSPPMLESMNRRLKVFDFDLCENVDQQITKVRNEEIINCIFLLINGTVSRWYADTENFFSNILKIIPQELIPNIILILTNVNEESDRGFKPKKLEDLGLNILGKEHVFHLNNPYALYQKKCKFTPQEWEGKFKHAFDMINKICAALPFQYRSSTHFGQLYSIIEEFDSFISDFLKLHEAYSTTKYRLTEITLKLKESEKNGINSLQCSDCSIPCHLPCKCDKECCVFEEGICKMCTHDQSAHVSVRVAKNETINEFEDLKITMTEQERSLQQHQEKLQEFVLQYKQAKTFFLSTKIKQSLKDKIKKLQTKIEEVELSKLLLEFEI